MSGGSYDYLCHKTELDELAGYSAQVHIDEMADRLTGLDEAVFPGAGAAAERTRALSEQLRIWQAHVRSVTELLEPVWRAVEWWDSGDWGSGQVAEALADYVTPPIPGKGDGTSDLDLPQPEDDPPVPPQCDFQFTSSVRCDQRAGHAGMHSRGTTTYALPR